jgi:hypothetical protein
VDDGVVDIVVAGGPSHAHEARGAVRRRAIYIRAIYQDGSKVGVGDARSNVGFKQRRRSSPRRRDLGCC